ncbi:DUF5085 family protein [Bacillus aquiflavi]|uniref:DUF5085 family protein n=1 Tax=Bacillus aquiflavi TaxID=2672567 RepID=A0A6B3VS16_9BACI|nr:DUF5085 family protein [Bacillus aquiflavi]MBA4535592.1 DUF5085 family protein [Bacillus aquiflavi]NEY79968.1 DUF5085 family protein [Bacillus aquiflavi]UAC48910.1 DUF5085 family protein [Bacillus aquiflavi]
MKIKRCPIEFHHVISTTPTRCKTDEWYMVARDFRNAIIKNGLYSTGPIIYQVANFEKSTNEADYTFYIPVNTPLEMEENDKFRFYESWRFNDGLAFRHADLDDDIEDSYELLRASAEAFNFELAEPFYNIYLDVYGDGIIDIYAPIVKEG